MLLLPLGKQTTDIPELQIHLVNHLSPASRYHTATAHTVLAALVGWIQLPQFMLSDLSNQCVEGILYSLYTQVTTGCNDYA